MINPNLTKVNGLRLVGKVFSLPVSKTKVKILKFRYDSEVYFYFVQPMKEGRVNRAVDPYWVAY